MKNKIKKLDEKNKDLFEKSCIKHALPPVEKEVEKNPTEEAQRCIRLVKSWLNNAESINREQLEKAAQTAASLYRSRSTTASAYLIYAILVVSFGSKDKFLSSAMQVIYFTLEALGLVSEDLKVMERAWQEKLLDKLLRKQEIESSSSEEDLLTLARDFIEQNKGQNPREILGAFRSKIKNLSVDANEKQMAINYLRQHLYENIIKNIIKTIIKEQIKRNK